MAVLLLSMVASIVIWTLFYGFKFSLVLITAIFIHEYGHFYWMGKEGIKDKDMFFMPPFGAVARSKEIWPSYGAELRISLAGPIAGLLSVLLFYALWLVFKEDIFLASILIACIINLFNLLFPIPVLDGGRVIKSSLYSISRTLGDCFYIFGFIVLGLCLILGYVSFLVIMLIGFFLFQEWSGVMHCRSSLRTLNIAIEQRVALFGPGKLDPSHKRDVERAKMLDKIVNIKKMSLKEIFLGTMSFVTVVVTYWCVLAWVLSRIDGSKMMEYFK